MEMDKEKMRQWVEGWKRASIALEQQRRQDIRNTNTEEAILSLDDAFEAALLHSKPRLTSGLVEQQKIFAKARRQST